MTNLRLKGWTYQDEERKRRLTLADMFKTADVSIHSLNAVFSTEG